ncbi:MAG TPA: low-complexity protein [Cyanobacteria bacterium UBA11371]|nr:low-complexity protein [Cyanobacteria bacterium UBA11371]HBE35769.1 low-complexity protein [Cyanobacteria bacterium UBA11368]
MTSDRTYNFTNKDLRNRSFKGRNLKGANFSGADIRGCDFSYAILAGANFERVRTGMTFRRVILGAIIAIVTIILTANAVIRTVFPSLGEPVGGKNWTYIVALIVSLGISGAGSGIETWFLRRGFFRETRFLWVSPGKVAFVLSATASGAFIGFVYAGFATDKNPQIAILGATIGGLLMAFLSFRFPSRIVVVAVASAGAVTGYGLAFWLWAVALSYLTGKQLVWGIGLSMLSLTYLALTFSSLVLTFNEIKKYAGTSFINADLTNAVFDSAMLKNTDLSVTMGIKDNI